MKKTLQQYRKENNLTQVEAAKKLGISPLHLSHIENKVRNPSDKLKNKMANLYKVSIAEIFLAIQLPK